MENKLPYKICLIHNPFNKKEVLTYLSAGIRYATESHWNHVAIEVSLGGEDYILESIGKGVILTKKHKWLTKSSREVLVMEPVDGSTIDYHELLAYLGKKYGVLDILQIAKYLLIRKHFSKDYTWDGKRGTRLWGGIICSELAALLMHLPEPHLAMPCDFERMDQLEVTDRFFTHREMGRIQDAIAA